MVCAAGNEYLTADELWDKRQEAKTAGFNLLMNLGPLPDGRFPDQAVERLQEAGERRRAEP